MNGCSGKSKRRAHVKQRAQMKARRERQAAAPAKPELPPVVVEAGSNFLGDACIRGVISGFVLGGALALREGHGQRPSEFYSQPQRIAQLAVMPSTTSSSGSLNFFTLLDS